MIYSSRPRTAMKQVLDLTEPAAGPEAHAAPRLLVELEPWYLVFRRNLGDLFRPRLRQPRISSPPAPFWPDVFVPSRLPWRRFAESGACHTLAIGAVWGFSILLAGQPRPVPPRAFDTKDVITYSASDFLPPLDTGTPSPTDPQPGKPEYSRQPIISVPPNPDNRTQTIVTPPNIKLPHDVPLPNIVAMSHTQIPVPIAATARPLAQMKPPALPTSVIEPTPELDQAVDRRTLSMTPGVIAPAPEVHDDPVRRTVASIQPVVIEPPPSTEMAALRRMGDINIGHSEVVAPAPQLPMSERRSLGRIATSGGGPGQPQVVPPPPSLEGAQGSSRGGNLIALGIHPVAPAGPITPPAGNRRGTFAATPEGKSAAPGSPDIRGDQAHPGNSPQNGSGRGNGGSKTGLPPGLFVGVGPKDAATTPVAGQNSGGNGGTGGGSDGSATLMAKVTPPRVRADGRHVASPVSELRATDADKRVFGDRRFYSLSLNMPNLNSAGGSWVIRFAELKDDGAKGDLLAPEAIKEVDPAYPIELMRRNVQGTVTLRAVIRSDGTVGDISVLNGVDDQLDQYAREALGEWQFRPAEKNGTPVDLEAVVVIPFKPQRKLF